MLALAPHSTVLNTTQTSVNCELSIVVVTARATENSTFTRMFHSQWLMTLKHPTAVAQLFAECVTILNSEQNQQSLNQHFTQWVMQGIWAKGQIQKSPIAQTQMVSTLMKMVGLQTTTSVRTLQQISRRSTDDAMVVMASLHVVKRSHLWQEQLPQ